MRSSPGIVGLLGCPAGSIQLDLAAGKFHQALGEKLPDAVDLAHSYIRVSVPISAERFADQLARHGLNPLIR
jgi:hypothetical protein